MELEQSQPPLFYVSPFYCVASVGIRNVVLEIAGPALWQLDRNKTEYWGWIQSDSEQNNSPRPNWVFISFVDILARRNGEKPYRNIDLSFIPV